MQIGSALLSLQQHTDKRGCCLWCCLQGGVQGEVRSWLRLPGSVVFNMKHNRWCGNVERPHKSNGIYYVGECSD
jgi:hypothetical protein